MERKQNNMCAFLGGILVIAISAAAEMPERRVDRLNQAWKPEPAESLNRPAGLFDTEYSVPMRDGVNLRTTVFQLPGGPKPVLLIRTPLNQPEVEQLAQVVMLTGYAVAIQNTRGRFGSEGEDVVFQSDGWGELQDGFDTVKWIAQQSWCNGKIGIWGYSALGITASMAGAAAPPELDCLMIGYAPSKAFGQVTYQGGAFRKSLVDGWLDEMGSVHMIPTFRENDVYGPFWEQFDIESRHPHFQVPTLFVGGWYDTFQQGTLNNFAGIQVNGADGARGRQQLVMGPWTHVNRDNATQGELTYPPNAIYESEITDTLEWFNHWLKGDDNGVDGEPAATYYVMGDVTDPNAPGNEWRTSDVWPPESETIAFHLRPDFSLSQVPAGADGDSSSFGINPADLLPTLGGFNLKIPEGPFDQSPIEARADETLVFATVPLEEPMEIIGRVSAVIHASSNLEDMDLTARLTDVYPDGRSMLVCDGILRASFRESDSNPTPIVPGEIYEYEIDLWSTALAFNRGHRIGLIVGNSNSPRFEANPVYAQLGQGGVPAEAVTTVFHSEAYPSRLLLPVTSDIPDTAVSDWAVF